MAGKKKGFLASVANAGAKAGLWETGSSEPTPREEEYDPAMDAEYESFEEAVEVVTGSADAVDFIGQTYHNNGIDDLSRSIFKVEETRNTLPNTLPKDVRRTTVISILASFGITVDELFSDAQHRKAVVAEVCRVTADGEQEIVDKLNQEIEELRLQITEKQQQVQDHQQSKQEVIDVCDKELARITDLCEFLGIQK